MGKVHGEQPSTASRAQPATLCTCTPAVHEPRRQLFAPTARYNPSVQTIPRTAGPSGPGSTATYAPAGAGFVCS